MKLLVVSDTHGNRLALREAIDRHPDVNFLIHLGDGLADLGEVQRSGRCPQCYMVRGNCDYAPQVPAERLCGLAGHLVFMTHGNGYDVKLTVGALLGAAREKNAQIALYGHTHIPLLSKVGDVWLFNPGSLSLGPSGQCRYGLLKLSPGNEPEFEHCML